MVQWHCQYCGPTEAETDERMGHIVCLECGAVLEENTIVSEVTFSETSKGSAIADGFQLLPDRHLDIPKCGQESREQTLQNGHRRIQEVANQPQIRMNERLVGHARRFFNVAVVNNFTKGRKSGNVVAACLYIVCRLEKTAHMLIDFADALSTNVYQVGATFLALCKISGVDKMPLVDPSLYISRFAAKLDFGEDTQNIVKDANRLVQRMCRDWMQTGRRPAGICAASLFVASRMHNHNRTIREIILVVKICEATLRRRLREFRETPSSNLSVQDFQTIWLEGERDPPSFAPPKTRKHEPASQLFEDSNGDSKAKIEQAFSSLKESVLAGDDDEDLEDLNEQQLLSFEQSLIQVYNKTEADATHQIHYSDNLSDLDDDQEIQAMIDVTPEEVEFKEAIWTEENKEWILRQQAKAALGIGLAESEKRKPKKRPRVIRSYEAPTAAEAAKNLVMSKPTLSKKINYGVLETLFEKTEKSENESTNGI
ncbi:hypothetical protein BDEG_25246 [Batrachochytrium dendrobatidis JEL423]|uniref:B-related factor 1 n=1 Tax=Batrachochytrium dendrobatidis (strain JEL423) TaxID=403673 RepID=A0A177WPG3_BATDL|nr:hypothetical protein BDEG_25246 [Batrachochytrium dendrobatidis JEL423]